MDSISNMFGWVSISCWIIVYSPQLYENYALQSGEGLSILFVVVWLLGDLFNLLGAVAAGLLPTIIILALYYTLCDIVLLCQIYYYRWKRIHLSNSECEPLLSGSTTRQETVSATQIFVRYTAALFFVFAVGIAAWWIGDSTQQDPAPEPSHGWLARALGWGSAILYIGARIPQIEKNLKTRCEGLSPALFFFAIFGNVTFSLSICAKSMDMTYLITNAGWLAGSILTIFLDVFVSAAQVVLVPSYVRLLWPGPLPDGLLPLGGQSCQKSRQHVTWFMSEYITVHR